MMKEIFFLYLAIIVVGCEDPAFADRVWSLKVKNETQQELYVLDLANFYNKETQQFENLSLFPDTNLPMVSPPFIYVKKDGENHIDFKKDHEKIFEAIPSDTLSVFIFNKDTIEEFSWEKIQQDYKVLKRYDLTYIELKENNWTITFP